MHQVGTCSHILSNFQLQKSLTTKDAPKSDVKKPEPKKAISWVTITPPKDGEEAPAKKAKAITAKATTPKATPKKATATTKKKEK